MVTFLHEFANFLVRSTTTNIKKCMYTRTQERSLKRLETGSEAGNL